MFKDCECSNQNGQHGKRDIQSCCKWWNRWQSWGNNQNWRVGFEKLFEKSDHIIWTQIFRHGRRCLKSNENICWKQRIDRWMNFCMNKIMTTVASIIWRMNFENSFRLIYCERTWRKQFKNNHKSRIAWIVIRSRSLQSERIVIE